jgi:hypothetical protein
MNSKNIIILLLFIDKKKKNEERIGLIIPNIKIKYNKKERDDFKGPTVII